MELTGTRPARSGSVNHQPGSHAARPRTWPPAWYRSSSGQWRRVRCCVRHRSAALLGSDRPPDCWHREALWRSRRSWITSAYFPQPQLASASRGDPLGSNRMAGSERGHGCGLAAWAPVAGVPVVSRACSGCRYGPNMGCSALGRPDFSHFEGIRLPIRWITRAVGLLQEAGGLLWL